MPKRGAKSPAKTPRQAKSPAKTPPKAKPKSPTNPRTPNSAAAIESEAGTPAQGGAPAWILYAILGSVILLMGTFLGFAMQNADTYNHDSEFKEMVHKVGYGGKSTIDHINIFEPERWYKFFASTAAILSGGYAVKPVRESFYSLPRFLQGSFFVFVLFFSSWNFIGHKTTIALATAIGVTFFTAIMQRHGAALMTTLGAVSVAVVCIALVLKIFSNPLTEMLFIWGIISVLCGSGSRKAEVTNRTIGLEYCDGDFVAIAGEPIEMTTTPPHGTYWWGIYDSRSAAADGTAQYAPSFDRMCSKWAYYRTSFFGPRKLTIDWTPPSDMGRYQVLYFDRANVCCGSLTPTGGREILTRRELQIRIARANRIRQDVNGGGCAIM